MLRILTLALPEYERNLIPEGRVSGSMPWIIAIMSFLTILAVATGLVMMDASQSGGRELSRQLTVQILAPDPAMRQEQARAALAKIKARDGVAKVEIVSDARIRELLRPWLGDDLEQADIPVPAMIEVELSKVADASDIAALRKEIAGVAPRNSIDSNADWMAPFFALMQSLLALTAVIVLLLLFATCAAVALAVRSALNTHQQTLEIMHMMGGTDAQAARLFQRRMALDALLGAVIGFMVAALVILLVGFQADALANALLQRAGLPWYGWVLLACIPFAVMGLAMFIARQTVLSALKNML